MVIPRKCISFWNLPVQKLQHHRHTCDGSIDGWDNSEILSACLEIATLRVSVALWRTSWILDTAADGHYGLVLICRKMPLPPSRAVKSSTALWNVRIMLSPSHVYCIACQCSSLASNIWNRRRNHQPKFSAQSHLCSRDHTASIHRHMSTKACWGHVHYHIDRNLSKHSPRTKQKYMKTSDLWLW